MLSPVPIAHRECDRRRANETEIIIRLAVAALGGMLLGADRELRGISAGIRTHGLVSLSSAVITVSALLLYYTLRAEGANIWLAAAIGIAAGAGQYFLLGVALVLGVILITVVRIIERLIPGSSKAERD